eukprot:TRINITY_DN4881_c0_g1_i2.p1 TRINITY_DN4881_c0_g1~~TRINITY_DN4881_c0_g1_i2.p1  ORF type:complete len:1169 (+),score=349.70 TRINITY_DN4881_c0_g1_i2:173-3679(+)
MVDNKERTASGGPPGVIERPVPVGTVAVQESFFAKFGPAFYLLPPPPPVEKKIYSFDQDDTEEYVVFTKDEDGTLLLKGGTVEKIVERLTSEKYTDPAFLVAFLLTYRSFMTPAELFDCLCQRFSREPTNLSSQDLEEWKKNVQIPVRIRVFNVIKTWVSTYYYDFAEDPKLVQQLQEFINNTLMTTNMEKAAEQLQKILQRKGSGKDKEEREVVFGKTPPRPFLPTNLTGALQLSDLNPEEVARQLTLIEYDLYKAIKPWECLGQAWAKKDKEIKAPNIIAMIKRFNYVSRWVATEIVKGETLKDRTNILKTMLEVAEKCKMLNNFNGMMEIISGLQSSAIYRLKQTWAALPTRLTKLFEEINALMSSESNFRSFRQHLHTIDPPCIPYLGVYLTDLTFIEDGNPDLLAGGLINFVKRRKLCTVIREIQQYQQTPYCLEPVAFIQDFLLNADSRDEEECYKISLSREQKQDSSAATLSKKDLLKKTQSQAVMKPQEPASTSASGVSDGKDQDDVGELEVLEGYRFGEKDSDDNIVFSKEGAENAVKGGTIEKLIERLTHDKYPDTSFLVNFLMTFPTFVSSEELLDLLIMRFNPPKPVASATKEQQERFKKRLIPIHFRVFNVLKNWVERFWDQDFKDKPELIEKLMKFIENDVKAAMEKASDQILKTIQKKMEGSTDADIYKPLFSLTATSAPQSLLKIAPEQIAAALTQFHTETYLAIKPREVLRRAWIAEDKTKTPCILLLKEQAKKIGEWVLSEIVKESNLKRRANMLAYFIHVTELSLDMCNIEAVYNLLGGISLVPVQFDSIWDWVSSTTQKRYQKIMNIIKSNKSIQDFLSDKPKPWIQSIDNILQEIVELEETQPDYLDNNVPTPILINFDKRKMVAEKLLTIQSQARGNPKIVPNHIAIDYLKQTPILSREAIKRRIDEITKAELETETVDSKMEVVPGEYNDIESREAEMGSVNRGAFISQLLLSHNLSTPNDSSLFNELKPLVEREVGKSLEGLDRLVPAIREEAVELARNCQDEITVARYYAGFVPMDAYKKAAKSITARVFQHIASMAAKRGIQASLALPVISEWTHNDESGEIFGWPEELYYILVEKDNKKTLVDVQSATDKPQVSSVVRALVLFTRNQPPGSDSQAIIITSSVTPEARSFASRNDIEIFLSR